MINTDKIDNFPSAPGVYLMHDPAGNVLYVGKARDLRRRVRSYFGSSKDSRWHIRFLMDRVADIGCIVTDTEKEALILENTLIKKHRPRYNFNLRDDKTYFSLRMDMNEPFPRLTIVRKVPKDGAQYFGPYSSASAARDVLKELYRVFPLRHYPYDTCRQRRRPCLFHQIRQCSAPCHGLITSSEYAALAEGAALFLAGKKSDLIGIYKKRMADAATAERYEEAARYRDLLRSIEITLEKQKMVTYGGDADVMGMSRSGSNLEIVMLHIRGGALIGSRSYSHTWEMDDAEGAASFLGEYYSGEVFIPEEVLIPLPLPEADALVDFLSERQGKKVTVTCPRRGRKRDLVDLAVKNAETAAQEKAKAVAGSEALLLELQERLHLTKLPRRIECYDISNIQGQLAVGSRVSFLNGRADKSSYRHYRIRTVSQADDFGMMREVLSRRFNGPDDLPDLIVVDGGIGQLNILREVLKELSVEGVDAVSLAKSRVERSAGGAEITRSDERVFLVGRKNPVVLRQNGPPLLLLAHLRDEAHRFAISYHKKLRTGSAIRSRLEEVPGIGVARKKALLRHFGSLQRLESASVEEIAAVKGMTRPAAEVLWRIIKEDSTANKNASP